MRKIDADGIVKGIEFAYNKDLPVIDLVTMQDLSAYLKERGVTWKPPMKKEDLLKLVVSRPAYLPSGWMSRSCCTGTFEPERRDSWSEFIGIGPRFSSQLRMI